MKYRRERNGEDLFMTLINFKIESSSAKEEAVSVQSFSFNQDVKEITWFTPS